MSEILHHNHLVVRAEMNNPPKCTNEMSLWVKNLVDKIGMKILMGPYVVYSEMEGNRGLTAVAIIETSHVAFHFWDEVNPALAQVDIYSCSKFELSDIFESLQVFEPVKVEYKYIDRDHNLTEIESGER